MLWVRPPLLIVLPLVVMPLALLLFVGGYTQRNPTAVMQGKPLPKDRPAPGVLAITRHPLMWAIGLWALVHLVISDSVASIIFFGAFAILALHGTRVLDAKKQRTWPRRGLAALHRRHLEHPVRRRLHQPQRAEDRGDRLVADHAGGRALHRR